jgi:circadian clock protein KaiB
MQAFALSDNLNLRLYIAGDTYQSRITIENIKIACSRYREGKCKVEVIDIKKDPAIAIRDQIFAIPTLVRVSHGSSHQYIGNLMSVDNVIRLLKKK